MNESYSLIFPIILPVLTGLFLLAAPNLTNRKIVLGITTAGLIATCICVFSTVTGKADTCILFYLTKSLPIYFKLDITGKIFSVVFNIVWLLSGFFAFEYMKHETGEKRYFGFYLIVYGILIALGFSGNIITYYVFFELLTLFSVPLVLHTKSKEAIMAGLKYLFYSLCGAYMVLFGIYFLNRFANTLSFTPAGVLNQDFIQGREHFLLFTLFLMIIGFSVKAGMFPLHGWLWAAHPVAPAPASAVLSGIIVKCGVLGIIRTVYYLFGADFVRGTWVQTVWIVLALFTVFMGSMLAYREKLLKKRLAYSTISQVSYILFGLAILHPVGYTGAILHVICHAFIKSCLFLCAGAIIYKTGKTKTDELTGIGKQMPLLMCCYTVVSLALIGIPPTGGFISKWYLAMGALESSLPFFSWFGPIVLLVSALLTAGYLLPVAMRGFFPGRDFDEGLKEKKEPSLFMMVPIMILTVLTLITGLFPNVVTDLILNMTADLL